MHCVVIVEIWDIPLQSIVVLVECVMVMHFKVEMPAMPAISAQGVALIVVIIIADGGAV